MYTNQNMFLNWFGILTNSYESYVHKISPVIRYSDISVLSTFKLQISQLTLQGFWSELQNGFCLADIDRTIIFIILLRFVILSYRYNVLTSIVITSAGIAAAYVWYNRFSRLILMYEKGLYHISYTNKLAVDASQIRLIVQRTVKNSDYQIRITNPVGVLMYAFGNGSIYQGHRIDPLSMIISRISDNVAFKNNIENIYYLLYRRFIPTTFRIIKLFNRTLNSVIIYNVITRVNKKHCPYILRWHWTACILISGIDRIFLNLFIRIEYYLANHLIPNMKDLDKSLSIEKLKMIKAEFKFLESTSLFIIALSLGLTLFLLFHALCGQYVYLPIVTKNVELHLGTRNKDSIYSGGLTAWQDFEEHGKYKIWFGFFGRGTTNKKDPLPRFRKFLSQYFRNLFKRIKKNYNRIRRIFDF